jgi:CrcB protein
MMITILICLAGAIGAVCRFGITQLGNRIFNWVPLPLATLVINLSGAFALGVLAGAFAATTTIWLVGSGFMGGFTTFSTFSNEVVTLFNKRRLLAIGYLALTAFGGVLLAALGASLT